MSTWLIGLLVIMSGCVAGTVHENQSGRRKLRAEEGRCLCLWSVVFISSQILSILLNMYIGH